MISKHMRFGCTSTALLALMVANPSFGQDAAAQDQTGGVKSVSEGSSPTADEIVVTGLRNSLNSAQDRKRNSDQIVDSVNAQDIGRLPDTNIVESLQRITGVQIERRYGEGGAEVAIKGKQNTPAVAIRGLTQVRYLFDGRDTYSAGGGRNLAVEAFPPEILAGMDVYKNPSAEMIEGGIGGLVNLRTRLPFDQNWRLMYATGRVNYYDLAGKTGYSASGLYSNRWQTGIGEIGVLINPVYNKTFYRQDSILVQPFYDMGLGSPLPGAPANARVPYGFQIYDESGSRERFALSGALQWQASPDLLVTATGLYSDYKFDRSGKYLYNMWGGEYPHATPGSTFTYAPDGRVLSGSFDNNLFASGRGDQNLHSVDQNYTLNVAWNATSNLLVKFDAQYVKSVYNANESGFSISQFRGVYDRSPGYPVYEVPSSSPYKSIVDFDLSGSKPTWSVRGAGGLSDPNSWHFASIGDYRTRNNSDQIALRADLEWTVDSGIIKKISAGGRYADTSMQIRRLQDEYYTFTIGNQRLWWDRWWLPNGNYYIPYTPERAALLTSGPSSNFFGGTFNTPVIYPNLPAGGSVADKVSSLYLVFGAPQRQNFWPSEVNPQSEQSLTGYVSTKLAATVFGLPVDGTFGARFIHTKTSSEGYIFPNYLPVDPTDPANLTAISAKNDYNFFLPSANIRVGLTDRLQMRLAYAKAMTRPDFWQMGTYVTLNQPTIVDPVTRRPSGSSGNPFLRPMKSDSFDMSLEWYFAKAGSLTGALFYKKVNGFIASGVAVREFNGIEYDISTMVNSGNGTVKGAEVAYQQFFDFLPGVLSGLGLQANYTYVDSNVSNPFARPGSNIPETVPLEKLSKHSYNLVGMYEKNGVSARLAYSWRSRYLNTTVGSGATGLPQYQAPLGNLDASISYNLTKRISLTLEGVNLTNTMGRTYIGTETEPLQYSLNDRRFSLILRAYY